MRRCGFGFDYAGGWGKYRKAGYWKSVTNACGRYTGQSLPYLVTACTAPDGSHWALQSWQRLQPLLGFEPWLPKHTAWEFHLSHWSTELPKLELYSHWTYGGQWQGVFGRLTYLGKPVHGFGSNNVGNPKDRYGRNVYLDTFDSAYGPGWKREAGILVHRPSGTFCHSFVPQPGFPGYPRPGASASGPGIEVQGDGDGARSDAGHPGGDPRSDGHRPRHIVELRDVWDSVMQGDTICERERSA